MDGYTIYQRIQNDIKSGNIFSKPRSILEEYVAALSKAHANSHFGVSEFPGTCETVRMALAIKISEDANSQAKRESRIALFVSLFALVVGIATLLLTFWSTIFPKPMQVYSTQNKPVIISEPQNKQTEKQGHKLKEEKLKEKINILPNN